MTTQLSFINMTREEAAKFARQKLDEHGLKDWKVRLSSSDNSKYLGLCSPDDKCIILNGHHVDINHEDEVKNTILHEIAHALTPNHGHDSVWADKAKELGAKPIPCSSLSLPKDIIDAIRSGANVEVEFEEYTVKTPRFKVSRLQDLCPHCKKVAEEKFTTEYKDNKTGDTIKLIRLKCGHAIEKRIPRGTPFHEMITYDHIDNKCNHNWDKNTCTKCMANRPFEFQVIGAQFIEKSLASHKGAGVFDDMGLGKTLQSIMYLKYHPEACPVLFVVKSGVKFQFFKEILKWLGPKYIPQVLETGRDSFIPGLNAYIISYDLVKKFKPEELPEFKTVILDECQQIKNPDSSRTRSIRNLIRPVENVIPLSGTPWKNRGSEFFTVLNMLDPTRFPKYSYFVSRWVKTYYHGNRVKEGGIENPEEFKEFIKDIVIRRERSEVLKELPLINRTLFFCELDKITQESYDEETSEFVKWYNDKVIGGEEDSGDTQQNMLAKLQRMRHITGLSKIPATFDFVKEHVEETNRKIIVFVHHKDVGEILFDKFSKEFRMPVYKIVSSMDSSERFAVQENFNKTECCILIASTLAAGEGLNLQTCSDVVMHERQWNPANEQQAEDRICRIGQIAKNLSATYVTASGTVDEFMATLVEEKRMAFHEAMNKGEVQQWNVSSLMNDLAKAIVNNYNKRGRK